MIVSLSNPLTLGEIIHKIDLIENQSSAPNDNSIIIKGLNTLSQANKNQLSFCNDLKCLKELQETKAGVVLISQEIAQSYANKGQKLKSHWLICKSPRFNFDQLSLYFYPSEVRKIHLKAVIHPTASIGENCAIGASAVIGKNVKIGKNTVIYANVTIYDNIEIGSDCIIHSGAVIGSDGFGFELINGMAHKQPQIGAVLIGNHVEIGANTSIDRGSIGDTVIEDQVKIDNLVHIAHNVRIGFQTAIMGGCGIAGGAVIGQRCRIFGMVAINGHINIADGVSVHGHSTVTKSIKQTNSIWASTTREQEIHRWAKNTIHSTQLIELFQRVKELENKNN